MIRKQEKEINKKQEFKYINTKLQNLSVPILKSQINKKKSQDLKRFAILK